MDEEKYREVRTRFPGGLTDEEFMELTQVQFLALCISNKETLIKSYKELLQDVFKNHKTWIEGGASEEFMDWYKDLLRQSKNDLEVALKLDVKMQQDAKLGIA